MSTGGEERDDWAPTVITIVVITALVLPVAFGALGSAASDDTTVSVRPTVDSYAVVDGYDGNLSTTYVNATTGRALRLDGDGGPVAPLAGNLTNSSWSLAVTAGLNETADESASYTVLAYDNGNASLYREAGEWVAYYDNGTHDAVARAPASGFQPVVVVYDATSGDLSVRSPDGFESSSMSTTASPVSVSWNWVGRQDEVRAFGTNLTSEQANTYLSDPVAPTPNTDRLARLMMDQSSNDSTYVYFAEGWTSTGGASWDTGVPSAGSPIENNTDYVFKTDPLSIKYAQGGYLEGSPVIFVSWPPKVTTELFTVDKPAASGEEWLGDSEDITVKNVSGMVGRVNTFVIGSDPEDPGAGPMLVGILVMGAVISITGSSSVGFVGGAVISVGAAAVLSQAVSFVPKWIYAVALMLIGLLTATVIARQLK